MTSLDQFKEEHAYRCMIRVGEQLTETHRREIWGMLQKSINRKRHEDVHLAHEVGSDSMGEIKLPGASL